MGLPAGDSSGAETLWWRCHRRIIADALMDEGIQVRHLLGRPPGGPHVRGAGDGG